MKVLQREIQYAKNFYSDDIALKKILKTKLPPKFFEYADKALTNFGELCANEIDERAKYTDRDGQPKLIRYDRFGEEISEVWVNEGYKKTIEQSYNSGIVGYVHKKIEEIKEKGNYTYSFAQGYLLSQSEPGFYCPVTLSMATAFLLDHYADQSLKQKFLPHVCSTGEIELFEGATFLTERQGGSDVGANIVQAVKEGENYRLYGEKYFASNAGMCGIAMVLARIKGTQEGSKGLTLFAVPWKKEDGSLNHLTVRRLKDKLGVRAVPSGEVIFEGSEAFIVGDATKGIYYMLEALNLSRICNTVASIGIMKRALREAHSYASARVAFKEKLTNYPMIQDTLMKLAAKQHVELATTFDLIDQYDHVTAGKATNEEQLLVRLFIALLKKESAEQAIHFSHEAIEMHGGNGYIEDFVTPRLLRDAQVLTVWEGTANILAHELIRLVNKNKVHKVFIQKMRERISQLNRTHLVTIVEQKINRIEEKLNHFANFDETIQSFEAKNLMHEMALLYESVVAVENASKNGETDVKLAHIYLQDQWSLREFGSEMLTVKYYDDVFKN